MARYVPEDADIVWLEFDPQAGHEQKGYRPALVLSPAAYNGKTGLAYPQGKKEARCFRGGDA